jgi:tetratricopeptide (TPR) repeat protein
MGTCYSIASASAPVKHPSGISLAGFRALIDAYGGRAELEGKSTQWVKLNVVLPATASAQTPFTALMDGAHVAPATAFVSHAYDDEFLGMVDAIASLEAREGSSAFYYFDLLVVNQHGQDAVVPFKVLRDEFGQSVRAIGRTLLYLRWEDPIPLRRAWCVFEISTTLATGTGLQVIMPPVDVASFKCALVKDFDSLTYKTCCVDVEKATAREANDLVNIQRAIAQGHGFLKTNHLVIRAIKGWMKDEVENMLDEIKESKVAEGQTSALWRKLNLNFVALLTDYDRVLDPQTLVPNSLVETTQSFLAECRTFRARGDDMMENSWYDAMTLNVVEILAGNLRDQGKLGEAEPLMREALALRRRTQGDVHPGTFESIHRLADLLKDQGKLDDAEPLYREALAGYRRTLGDERRETLRAINDLAILLRSQGKLGEAEPLYCEALAGNKRMLGDEHPDTLDSIFNFACLLWAEGKTAEALEMYRQELECVRRVFGEDHPSTQLSLRNYNNKKK